MIVADTNLISYLFLTGPYSEQAEHVLRQDSEWVAPWLWRSEFRNVLALYIRQNILSLDQSIEIIEAAQELMVDGEYDIASQQVLRLANFLHVAFPQLHRVALVWFASHALTA